MNIDPSGHAFISVLITMLIGGLIGAAFGGISNAIGQAVSGNQWNWKSFGLSIASGAVSGVLSTLGVGLAITIGGIGGFFMAGTFGFLAGFSSKIIEQGVDNGWSKINWNEATIAGVVSSVFNITSFAFANLAMRESIGVFDNIFDKSIKYTTRMLNSLSISAPAILFTGMFSLPATIGNTLIDVLLSYYKKFKQR